LSHDILQGLNQDLNLAKQKYEILTIAKNYKITIYQEKLYKMTVYHAKTL
jgi:hypothetical protein